MRMEYTDGVNWVSVPNTQDIIYSNVPRGIAATIESNTLFSTSTTPIKIPTTGDAPGFLYDFTYPVRNRLNYTGIPTISVLVNLQISLRVESSTPNLKTSLYIYKNNGVIPAGNTIVNIPATFSETQISTQAFVPMSTNNYVEAWISTSQSASVRLQSFTMTVLGCGTSL